jgi:hypothetical protein
MLHVGQQGPEASGKELERWVPKWNQPGWELGTQNQNQPKKSQKLEKT